MKKDKTKALVKTARKAAQENIEVSLVTELKQVTGKLGQESKKLTKEIEKGSKQLAKKLAKELNIAAPAAEEPVKTPKVVKTPEAVKPPKPAPATKTAAKPVAAAKQPKKENGK